MEVGRQPYSSSSPSSSSQPIIALTECRGKKALHGCFAIVEGWAYYTVAATLYSTTSHSLRSRNIQIGRKAYNDKREFLVEEEEKGLDPLEAAAEEERKKKIDFRSVVTLGRGEKERKKAGWLAGLCMLHKRRGSFSN